MSCHCRQQVWIVNSSSHGDCNFDARLVSKTRKDQQTFVLRLRQEHLLSQKHGKEKRRHVHTLQSVTRSELFKSANWFLSNQSSASKRPTDSRSIHPMRQLLLYEHNQVQRYVRIRQIVLSWALSSICQSAINQFFTRLIVAHCLLLFFSLSYPSWSIHREKCSTLPPFQWFHSAFASISVFTVNSDDCLFLFGVLHLRLRLYPTDVPSSCGGVWDPWSMEDQSCKLAMLLYYWSDDWVRSTIFRCSNIFDTEVSILNSFLYPKISCIHVFRSGSCNRFVKECGVDLSLCISTFIESPRSMYRDRKDKPTWPPFTTP